jgi:hypothetical protein
MSRVQEMVEGLDLASLVDEIVKGTGYWAAVQDGVLSKLKEKKAQENEWSDVETTTQMIRELRQLVGYIRRDARLNEEERCLVDRAESGLVHLYRLNRGQTELIGKLLKGM